jgi:predicted AAA+ superfamily ATPase
MLAMYRGKLAEQFDAQELLAWHSSELYYWAREARGSNAEVDYLAVHESKIYPVEVKSGAGGSLRSLHLLNFIRLRKYHRQPFPRYQTCCLAGYYLLACLNTFPSDPD